MIGSACACRYLIMLSLLQRSIRLIMSWSTPEQRRSMAPAAHRDLAETSLCVKPRGGSCEEFYRGLEVGRNIRGGHV